MLKGEAPDEGVDDVIGLGMVGIHYECGRLVIVHATVQGRVLSEDDVLALDIVSRDGRAPIANVGVSVECISCHHLILAYGEVRPP